MPDAARVPAWSAVLWDLDGTLVDSIGLIVQSYQHAFTAVLGHGWDEAEIRSWIGQSLIGSMRKASPDHADEIFAAYHEWNNANTERLLRVIPGIPALLGALTAAGVRGGVVTSKREGPAHWALRLAGIDDAVPLLVSHDDVDEHKPSPKPLLLGASRLGVEPGRCVYIGDSPVDIVAAHNAGAVGIGVTWGAATRAELADASPLAIVDDAAELAHLLGVILPLD